jgi:hypothetical protein
VRLPLHSIFEHPTVAGLAAFADAAQAEASPAGPAPLARAAYRRQQPVDRGDR